jgi:2-polyprenyl-6-methoxyphenol hydroxylase-like FAD-dependent oxidoreductase
MQGHAYLLHCGNGRNVVGEGVLLVGDAAGVAYSQSGEGIRPAIESGLLAARAIIAAKGKYDRAALDSYRCLLAARFGRATEGWSATIGRHLPAPVISSAARLLLASKWFSRHVILDHWFLRSDEPAINFQIAGLAG